MFSPFKLLKLMFGDLKFSTMKLKVSDYLNPLAIFKI